MHLKLACPVLVTLIIGGLGWEAARAQTPANSTSDAAVPASVVIDDTRGIELKELDDDGGYEISVTVTNLTESRADVSAALVKPQPGCELEVTPRDDVLAGRRSTLKISGPASCNLENETLPLDLTAGNKTIRVTPKLKTDPEPDWGKLDRFLITGGILSIIGLIYLLLWVRRGESRSPINEPLKYLDKAYDFKDSWVSNVTVGAGLLTGIFASASVLKPFLGEDAESSLALATAGGAIAAALAAAAPLVLLGTQTRKDWPETPSEKDKRELIREEIPFAITPGGLVAASVLTLTGAFGGLWVLHGTVQGLDLNGLEGLPLDGASAFALLVLTLYAFRTMGETLRRGTTEEEKAPDKASADALLVAAAILATKDFKVVRQTSSGDDFESLQIESAPAAAQGAAETVLEVPAPARRVAGRQRRAGAL